MVLLLPGWYLQFTLSDLVLRQYYWLQMQLRKYKQDLREYRALSLELKTWTDAFEEKHGRKPTEHDVKATRIPWLEDRFVNPEFGCYGPVDFLLRHHSEAVLRRNKIWAKLVSWFTAIQKTHTCRPLQILNSIICIFTSPSEWILMTSDLVNRIFWVDSGNIPPTLGRY